MLNLIISLISGVLLSLAFTKLQLNWLAWFTLAPLFHFTFRLNWKRAILCSVVYGLGFFGGLLYWIEIFGGLPWVLLSIFQMLFVLAFVVAAKSIGGRLGSWGRLALLPSLWVVFEWIRSLGMLGFTWGDLGYSQYTVLPIVQISSVAGVWGVSYLIALTNAVLSNLADAVWDVGSVNTSRVQVFAMAIIVPVMFLFGHLSMKDDAEKTSGNIRAAIVQGNISQDTEENLDYQDRTWKTYRRLTEQAAENAPTLIVWPETVVPGCLGRDSYMQGYLSRMAAASKSYLLVGAWDMDAKDRAYNAAFLIGPGRGIVSKYAKVHLVPFGEFVPARKYLPLLRRYRVTARDTSCGRGYNLLFMGPYKIGTAICFESTFPCIPRRLTANGADVLCVITNDGWFLQTEAAREHMAMSVFRASENHRYVIRAAATGISCVVDPHGRILTRTGIFSEDTLIADIQPHTKTTPYTRFGDWLVYASIGLVLVLSAVSARKRL